MPPPPPPLDPPGGRLAKLVDPSKPDVSAAKDGSDTGGSGSLLLLLNQLMLPFFSNDCAGASGNVECV